MNLSEIGDLLESHKKLDDWAFGKLKPKSKQIKEVERVVAKIKKAFPEIKGIHKQFDGKRIFLGNAAEGGTIDGMPAADYYAEYGYSVHKKLTKLLSGLGYGIEWYDPGTIYAYPE